jgi:cytochrome P450
MLQLTQELFGSADPELARDREAEFKEHQVNPQVVAEFMAFFRTLAEDRRKTPTQDLASVIANAVVDGQPISPMDMLGYFMVIFTAGHDTTSSSTAGALWALAANPGAFQKLKADLSLIPSLVDESIRWTTPVKTFMRTASKDTKLGERDISKGDWLMLCYASGNRDELVFDDPDVFRVDRQPNKHLAFGYGAHLCLGQHLAKMEMRILWEELIPRLTSLELAGEPAMSESFFVNGPKRLPVRFRLE